MSLDRDLQDAFKVLAKPKPATFSATVVSVDKNKGTCIIDDGELEYIDVRLSAIIDEEMDKNFLYPKIGSSVLVSMIDNDLHNLYVDAYSEVEKYYIKIGDAQFEVDESGILLKKGDENMQKLMLDLIKTIRKMKFTTNTGSTIKLINEPEFIALEPRFKNLLKSN